MTSDMQKEGWAGVCPELAKPLSREYVSQRQEGYGDRKITLSYLEGWRVIDEMNRIFGHDGWERRTVQMDLITEDNIKTKAGHDAFGVAYMAKVELTVLGVVREGYGYGSGIDRGRGKAHEGAIKEAETDAMKRAAMTFGYPLGLALYDKKQENVE